MKRLLLVIIAGLAVFAAVACAPVKQPAGGGVNGSTFEHTITVDVNNLRAAYGRYSIGWSNYAHDYAMSMVVNCANRHAGPTNLESCHTGDGVDGDLIFWPGSCDESAGRAQASVDAWRNSPGHLVYLVDYG